MNKNIKNIIKVVLIAFLMIFSLNGKTMAATAIDADATWTASSRNII